MIASANLKVYTILRPTAFMESLERFPPSNGTLSFFLPPEVRVQMISVVDIGQFARIAFQNPQDYHQLKLEIAGDYVSGPDIAAAASRVNGHPIKSSYFPRLWMLRFFSKEMYLMARFFVTTGYIADLADNKKRHPTLMSVEEWMRYKGWANMDFGRPRQWTTPFLAATVVGLAAAAWWYLF